MTDYFDLGTYSRPVTTTSPEAQTWFDRGLIWCYAYNHDESVRCFREATEHDPNCAMAYWGIAYASGSNYNKKWEAFAPDELKEAVATARSATETASAHLDGASPVEQALIRALEKRYQSNEVVPYEAFAAWNDAYATAMRAVHAAFSDDLDVCALFAEALINRTPWQLWDLKTGKPAAGADTLEAVAVLEQAMAQMDAPHPGVLHMYIHTMEMSPHPEKALRASDALRDLVPDAGHLRHMPSHIDVLCGLLLRRHDRQQQSHCGRPKIFGERKARSIFIPCIAATTIILSSIRPCSSASIARRWKRPMSLIATIPEELLRVTNPPMADWLEGFVPMKLHVLVRFGKWQEIFDAPLPDDAALYCVTTAMLHYAKGVAHAASGQIDRRRSRAPTVCGGLCKVPDTRYVFNNKCIDILAIAAEMLNGEIEYRKGNYDAAFAHLRKRWRWTTTCPTTNRGAGCNPLATLWARCCWSRTASKRRCRSIAPIWGWTTRSAAPRSTPTMCGACTAMWSACTGWANTPKPLPCS